MPTASQKVLSFFPTLIWHRRLMKPSSKLLRTLIDESYKYAEQDETGQKWSRKNYPGGYTSYGSLTHLHKLSPHFADLEKQIHTQVLEFAKCLEFDIPLKQIYLQALWLNIMPKGTAHSMHLHPLSTISGTFYLQTPRNTSALKFEDPRLAQFMASPPRKSKSSSQNQRFIKIEPQAGEIILFESWLRHEVPPQPAKQDRISVSFNYGWG